MTIVNVTYNSISINWTAVSNESGQVLGYFVSATDNLFNKKSREIKAGVSGTPGVI